MLESHGEALKHLERFCLVFPVVLILSVTATSLALGSTTVPADTGRLAHALAAALPELMKAVAWGFAAFLGYRFYVWRKKREQGGERK